MWHPAKLALGAAITACFVAYYVALETSCADMSQRGELVMTSGGTAEGDPDRSSTLRAALRMVWGDTAQWDRRRATVMDWERV